MIGGGPSIGSGRIALKEEIPYLPIAPCTRRKKTSRRRRPPKQDDGRGVELREKSGEWKFYKSQKDAAEAFPGLIQGDISRLINNPREVSRHIRERFRSAERGPQNDAATEPPSTIEATGSYLRGNQPVEPTTGTSRRWRGAPKI